VLRMKNIQLLDSLNMNCTTLYPAYDHSDYKEWNQIEGFHPNDR
jgi:hypothetical protein